MRRRMTVVLAAALLTSLGVSSGAPAPAGAGPRRPERVLIIVLDQMRPDYVRTFDMENVRALMNGGVNYPNAVLGHMAATTVVSHNVITSGMFPKHMGWTNEVYRDVGDRLGGGEGAYYVTSSFDCEQFGTLIESEGYPKLEDYLGRGTADAKFVAIGQKTTAACPAGQPTAEGVDNDIIVRMGSSQTLDCDGDGTRESWRGPSGVNVPSYLSNVCGRFYVNTTPTYGTATTSPAWMYPLDGDRYAVGTDPQHRGGDIWTADTAIKVMENETDWRGMLVSFPSIDKMAHMWGANDKGPSGKGKDVYAFAHLPKVAKIADRQVGRLLGELEAQGLSDETLVVLTADHAGQTARRYHGVNAPDQGNYNWYYGAKTGSLADESYLDPSPAIESLVYELEGNVEFTYQDGHIGVWLHDTSRGAKRTAARELAELPDVIATYARDRSRYELVWSGGVASESERKWWHRHAQEIVDTMAARNGPDAVALLRDDTSYGVKGDHGGHQRPIQRIPITFTWPGLRSGATPDAAIRSADILPTILRLMGIQTDSAHPMDGRAVRLPRAALAED
jgi:type I phosphodiesterase/nucleotide pyrophosphatase